MIKVNVKTNAEQISEVTISGHANHGDYGNDIVCAATSSIVITTINAILKLENDSINYKDKDGFINIKILRENFNTNTLVENMIGLLKELEMQYPKNIKLN